MVIFLLALSPLIQSRYIADSFQVTRVANAQHPGRSIAVPAASSSATGLLYGEE